jgi:hypothetical protein
MASGSSITFEGYPFGQGQTTRAVRAGAAQRDVVRGDVVAEPAAGALDQGLELGVLERGALAAGVADRVVMVLAAGVGRLEAGGAADLDAVHEPEPVEHVERPVDAGQADRAVALAQAVVDVLGAQAAVLR